MFVAFFRGFRGLGIGVFCLFNIVACGFTPAFAPGSSSAEYLSDISFSPPNSHVTYLFVKRMEERLGRNLNAGKILRYNIDIKEEGYELASNRVQRVGTLRYQLISRNDQRVLQKGAIQSFTGFTVSGRLFDSTRRDADERLVVILADKLVTELIANQARQ